MFHYENGHIQITNPIVRLSKSLQWVPIMICATLLGPNQPNQCSTASPVRARGRQIRGPKMRILGGICRSSYPAHVTVYPYNRYIKSTNPIVRCVVSLTWTIKRMRANQHAPKHATTQPLHDSNTRAPAPNLVASWERRVGAPTKIMLPFIRTTDTLEVQILSYDMSCH